MKTHEIKIQVQSYDIDDTVVEIEKVLKTHRDVTYYDLNRNISDDIEQKRVEKKKLRVTYELTCPKSYI